MAPRNRNVELTNSSDLSLSPLNAALRSRVIPSSSRLLVKMTQPSAKGSGYDDDQRSRSAAERDGLGWSGSESEEEEFSRTVARIARRKSGAPARQLFKRPSLPAGSLKRFSDFGATSNQTSPASTSGTMSGGPPTPSVAERPSTSLGTSRGHSTGTTAALLTALVEQKYASRDMLPRPKKFVSGWGAPEVLLEDDWPPDSMGADDDVEHITADPSTGVNSKQAGPGSSLPRPLGAAW